MRIPPEKVTIVFDTGNNSKASMELLDDTPYYFVGSLKPYDYKHFMEITLEKFPLVPMENGEEALGAERTVVVTYEKRKSFGKTILFTNNHEWSTAQIIRFYRG